MEDNSGIYTDSARTTRPSVLRCTASTQSDNHLLRSARPVSSQPTAKLHIKLTSGQQHRCSSASPTATKARRKSNTVRGASTITRAKSVAVSFGRTSRENVQSTEDQQQLPTPGSTILSDACYHCGTENKRKRQIRCDSCGRHWHLTCAHIKRMEGRCPTALVVPRMCGHQRLRPDYRAVTR